MSGEGLLVVVAMALGLALQPWSILAAVLLVASQRGLAKEVAFLLGWMLALSAVALAAALVAPQTSTSTKSSSGFFWADLVLGVALAAVAAWQWRRPTPGGSHEPRWLRSIDAMPPKGAFVLGGFLPNYVLVVAAVNELLRANLTTAQTLVGAAAFVVVASLGVAMPLLVLVARPRQAAAIFDGWGVWLVANSRLVMLGLCAFLAVLLVAKGLWGLLS